MNREQITRKDFPAAADGYDRASVDAHLNAVAAALGALEAQVSALEVEREALRRQAAVATDLTAPEAASVETAPVPPDGPASAAAASPALSEPSPEAETPAPPRPDREIAAAGDPDEVSARLVATKMALDGAEREAIRLKLTADYELDDVDALVDDVLERVG